MAEPRRCSCGCGTELPAGSNRGEPKKFLNRDHKRVFERAARQVGAVTLAKQVAVPKKKRPRGPKTFDNRVSQTVLLSMVPRAERPALLAQAASAQGLTDGPVLMFARTVKRICDRTIYQGHPSPFCSPERIALLADQQSDPTRKLKLEAAEGVVAAALTSRLPLSISPAVHAGAHHASPLTHHEASA